MEINLEKIQQRIKELEEITEKLKKDFIGIDSIIDEFMKNIYIWYVMPEIQTRPLIISLWGLTGVGKTDLVRKFVNFANMNNRFIEIQLDTSSQSCSKIEYHLENIFDDTNVQGILLLDEIQRFRTVDERGAEIRENAKYSDLWMLLSDGKFESDSKNRRELVDLLLETYMDIDREENSEDQNNEEEEEEVNEKNNQKKTKPKKKKERVYKMWTWTASRLKRLLKLSEGVEEIMKWDIDKKVDMIKTKLADNSTFEGKVYSKLLVIIAGNLDEAYSMSDSVDEVDLDADIFHEFSKKITILNIKEALKRRFKPEQIARMGNIHIIYPSLSKDNYMNIIKMKINNINKMIFDNHNIKIKVDDTVYDTIYKNGVFPTQGVRPVLSTISSIYENSLPHFIFKSMLAKKNEIEIFSDNRQLVSNIAGEEIRCEIYTVIETLKKNKDVNITSLVAVHEAGHAVCYSVLFKAAPLQLICKTASDGIDGFAAHHQIRATKNNMKNQIMLSLGGQVAEEIFFGDNNRSTGCLGDNFNATKLASNYVRDYGFGGYSSLIRSEISDQHSCYNQDIDSTNDTIEKFIAECKVETKTLLEKNIDFLKTVIKKLFQDKEIKPDDYVILAEEKGYKINSFPTEKELIEVYYEQMQEKLN
jgi:cell division protease FtsH